MLRPSKTWLPVLSVFTIALLLRLTAAALLPMGADEAQTLQERDWAVLWVGTEALFNPPLWRAVVWSLLRWMADDSGLGALRMTSAVAGAAACAWLTWGLLRSPGDRDRDDEEGATARGRVPGWGREVAPAWTAGMGLATTAWLAREQAQARSYGLALLAAVAVLLALRRLVHRPTRRAHLAAALAVVAAAWTHFALLPWAALWWLTLAWTVRHAAEGVPPEGRRSVRQAHLLRAAGPGLAVGVLGLAWPLRQAVGGWWLKRGGASASMPGGATGLDLAWQPELLLALAVAIGLALAWRAASRDCDTDPGVGTGLALGVVGVVLAVGVLWAAGQARTVRWVHLVAAAPALWMGAAATLTLLPARAGRVATALLLGVTLWGSLSLTGTVASGHRWSDDRALATWVRGAAPPQVAAWTGHERGAMRPATRGLLHALGGYDPGPSRCTGPDRVHLPACRARVRDVSGTDCRGLCLGASCLWPLEGLPEPLTARAQRPMSACSPGILSARLPIAQALLLPAPDPRRRLDAAGLARILDLPAEVTRSTRLVRTGRWVVLVPDGDPP